MERHEKHTGGALLIASMLWLGVSVFCALTQSYRHQNFAYDAWEWGRFFELWHLWLGLPGSCAIAVLAAIRSGGIIRAIALLYALVIFSWAGLIGHNYWQQW